MQIKIPVQYYIEERIAYHKKEYALQIRLNETDWWAIKSWSKKPTKEVVEDYLYVGLRFLEVWFASKPKYSYLPELVEESCKTVQLS